MMPIKVAIIGLAPGYARAPWGDPTWARWGLNDGYLRYPGTCSAWWELHGDTPLTRARRPPDHFERIKAMDVPVYYLHGDPPTDSAIHLDIDALAAVGKDYFACTNAYQIARALQLGATEIALYGTPLAINREVVVERPCVAWWLGLAEGRGVKVTVDHDEPCGLLRHPYRYAADDVFERAAAFAETYRAFWSMASWIPHEDARLQQAECSVSTIESYAGALVR